MNEIKIFSSPEFGQVRVVDQGGEPWFVGKDIAEILGYANASKALADHVDDDDKLNNDSLSSLGQRGGWLINESGLYSLILCSKLPTAKAFKRWVTSEVLPSIRKHGGYVNGQEEMTEDELLAKALMVANSKINSMKVRISNLEVQNQVMLPKAEYFDALVDRNLLVNFTDCSKMIGVKRKALIEFCIEKGYLYRDQKGNLKPRANRKADGLFEVKQSSNEKTGWAGSQTLITPKGVETFRLLMNG